MTPNLPWIFLLLPLCVAAINWLLLSKRAGLASALSTVSALTTLALVLAYVFGLERGECTSYTWLPLSNGEGLSMGILLDDMALRMMLVVTLIGSLVHIFSVGYMKDDKSNLSRYFAGLSIFMFSMSTIVLSTNLAMTFIGWEMVGVSSYLLIGHWFNKDSAAEAAKKAFITNRVGDFGFLIGILLTFVAFGTLDFAAMGGKAATIAPAVLSVTVICLFCGAVGKSAQFPLHVWLPDAMEGPTPVSALIHAATMVAAGVYMLVRLQVSMGAEAFTPLACNVIASIGAITAVIAALMATQQDDIKRVLAYSTLSQLGYMVMAVGLLAGEAAMFHLYTHAWFKALLFLGAGAIIIACHHEQDIWKMGNLKKHMPITVTCFIIGTLALIAVPGFSGFFSKESILDAAYNTNPTFFWIGVAVAALTTFYMGRLCLIAFFGKERSEGAEHAHEVGASMYVPLIILAILAVCSGYGFVANFLAPHNEFHAHEFHVGVPFIASMVSLVVGIAAAVFFYKPSSKKDCLANNCVAKALCNRLYIDCFYDKVLIGGIQFFVALIIDVIDNFIIRGIIFAVPAYILAAFGKLMTWVQGRSLRAYACFTCVGLLVIMFLMAFTF